MRLLLVGPVLPLKHGEPGPGSGRVDTPEGLGQPLAPFRHASPGTVRRVGAQP